MSCRFARVLERELKAAGLPPSVPASCGGASSARVPAFCPDAPGAPASPPFRDTSNFSARAVRLSRSLRHYAEDGRRPERRDPSLVTGWNEAGYLRDEGGGLGGEIRFATASGTVVSVKAESCPERGTQVTVRAVGNGVEHEFSLDDFSECRRDRRAGPARVTAYALAPGKGPGM